MITLHYLIYTSIRSLDCGEKDIQDILKVAKTFNQSAQITGVLAHTNRHFMQYVEGLSDALITLFDKIKKDPRHTDIILCYFSPLEKRTFPSWQMGYKDLEGGDFQLRSNPTVKEKEAFEQLINDNFHANCFDTHENVLEVLKLFL